MIITTSFDYATAFRQKLEKLQLSGNYRYFLDLHKSASTFPVFQYEDATGNRQQAVNWCSNDYLGQSTNPVVIKALQHAASASGTGSGGTRNISGTTLYHRQLEQAVADLVNKEKALVFSSAYLANQTILTTLGRHLEGAVFISDAENHASIIEGIRASKAEKLIFRHNDIRHLEEILLYLPADVPKIIVFESVYSMSGTIAPVEEICRLAKKYNALTYCDEVHAVGLYGEGAGWIAEAGCSDQVDLINGTFAKAFGVVGGFVAGEALLLDFIRSFAEGFIFTTSLPPSTCAAVTASIRYVLEHPELLKSFRELVHLLRRDFRESGITFEASDSHITRIVIGDSRRCKMIADRLLKEFGIYLQPINYPTVPKGEACLRIIVTAKHTTEHISELCSALRSVLLQIS